MEDLQVRLSVTTDSVSLQPLVERIGDILDSRYGTRDLPSLLEKCCLSITATTSSEDKTPVAMAFFTFPPQHVFHSYKRLRLACFLTETSYANDSVRLILRYLFETQPTCDMVETEVSLEAPLETSLTRFFFAESTSYVCRREVIIPPLNIRAARVEDYDDLMPLFKSDAPDLLEKYSQFFISDLIKSDVAKCLVAEKDNGNAVGFIAIEPDFNPNELADDYELSPFQDLLGQEGIAFRIKLFFISDEYRVHSRDFMKPIFALMRNAEYMVILYPTDNPPSPIAPYLTLIPSLNHGSQKYNMYICHRDSLSDMMLSVRELTETDMTLLENFVEPLDNREEIVKTCNDSNYIHHLYMVNEIIVGLSIFYSPKPIDHTKWDIEEFVDVKNCSAHVELLHMAISPLFQRFSNFFLIRSMEMFDSSLIYLHHRDGYLPDNIGRLFFAVERRQGPANPVFELHIQQLESLHIFPMRYSMNPKQDVTSNIIVVGSTEGVASFLYTLISVRYLHFSSIHVVCEGGAERIWANTYSCREHMPDWLQHLHLLNGATHFSSDLSEIHRDQSEIILDDQTTLSYDYLVLLTAKQGELADMWMAKKFCESTPPPVSVVGDSLVAYYILSHYPGCAHIAHNPRFKLEGTLANIIRDSTEAHCDFREVSPKLLEILEASSLVYDGGIVIDELFRTDDAKIFATGPITMFSRPYNYKDDGQIISQVEYGKQAGSVILKLVDTTIDFEEPPLVVGTEDAFLSPKNPSMLPKFSHCRAEMYHLPGNRIFYRNGYPATKCRCLETINGGKNIRFFVDAAEFIQAFEYLGESTGKIYDWNKFIGLPAVLLNNMVERYSQRRISDFAEYFNEEWCGAILHDRFRRFFDNLLDKLAAKGNSNPQESQKEIYEALMNFLIQNNDLLPNYYTSEDQLPALEDDE